MCNDPQRESGKMTAALRYLLRQEGDARNEALDALDKTGGIVDFFTNAVFEGDDEMIYLLLDTKYADGETSLIQAGRVTSDVLSLAISRRRNHIVKAFLDDGRFPPTMEALRTAIRVGNVDAVEWILENDQTELSGSATYFITLAITGTPFPIVKVVELLLASKKLKPDHVSKEVIKMAKERNLDEIVHLLKKSLGGETPAFESRSSTHVAESRESATPTHTHTQRRLMM